MLLSNLQYPICHVFLERQVKTSSNKPAHVEVLTAHGALLAKAHTLFHITQFPCLNTYQNNMSESVTDVWEESETERKIKILIEMERR